MTKARYVLPLILASGCARPSGSIAPDPGGDAGVRLEVVARGESDPHFLTADRDYLYWTSRREGALAEVRRMPRRHGATPSTIAQGLTGPSAIATRDGDVYVAALGGSASALTDHHTFRVHILKNALGAATAPESVVYGDAASGGVFRYPRHEITKTSRPPSAVAADEHHVYWSEVGGGLYRAAHDGTGAVELTSGRVGRFALDAGNVYFIDVDKHAIVRRPKSLAPAITLAQDQDGAHALAIDATRVVWTHPPSGTVRSAPVGGGAWSVVAEEQLDPGEIAADGGVVYWTTHEGTIVSLRTGA